MHLFLILALAVSALAANAKEVRPNILFIIADDCTYLDLGTYGGQALTPNLDALAKRGMKFERCFQAAPMCSPTRHSIYTGLYPVKSGAYPNHAFAGSDVKSIVHYLKPLGYRVALSGKSHVAPKEVFPFEESHSTPASSKGFPSVIDFEAVDRLMKTSAESKTPFALFACSNEPHAPWNKGKQFRQHYPPEKLKLRPYMVDTPETRKAYRNYLAEISFFDLEVGRLIEKLDQHGLTENTLVMVVSEQGNNFPFAKWSCYDAGLQSAMLVSWPGKVKPGTTTRAMVEYVDICPTLVTAAGGTPSESLDGRSFQKVLSGEMASHKDHVFGIQTSRGIFSGPHHYPIRSVRGERYKLIRNLDPDATFFNSINQTGWFRSWERAAKNGDTGAGRMLKRFAKRPAYELYDVIEDPHEMHNLADDPKLASVRSHLDEELSAWMKGQGDKGLATELEAFKHMLKGNQEFNEWRKVHPIRNPESD